MNQRIKIFCSLVIFSLITIGQSWATPFSMAFFNIDSINGGAKYLSKGDYAYPKFSKRIPIIMKTLADQNPSVVAFSEASFFKKDLELLTQEMNKLGYTKSFTSEDDKISSFKRSVNCVSKTLQIPREFYYRNSGIIIFTKNEHTLKNCNFLVYKSKYFNDKGAIICEIIPNGFKRPLYVGTTHFQAGQSKFQKGIRGKQFKEFKEFIDSVVPAEHKDRLILGGDLNFDYNSNEHSDFDKTVAKDEKLLNLHTKNILPDSSSNPYTETYVDWKGHILDHVYASSDLVKSLTLDTPLESLERKDKKVMGSDHCMLMIKGDFE